ncbi:MAG: hypothetical protein SGARI_006279 [Bacillariaceae sp.]
MVVDTTTTHAAAIASPQTTIPTPTIDFQSIASLYQGLTGNLWKEGPPSAVYLGVYETVKYALAPKVVDDPSLLLGVYLIAGAAGELVGSVIRAPAEATKSLFVKAFILNNPNIDFDSSTLMAEAIIGAFAGGFGAFLTTPADVTTTRIITAESSAIGASEIDDGDHSPEEQAQEVEPLNVFGMAKKIYEEEGPSAFFIGWQARVGYWAPAISIFLTCYCSVRQAGIQYNWFE